MLMYEDDILSQERLLAFLKQEGYDLTRSTILRYVQLGFLMNPKKKAKRITKDGNRIYYNRLAIIEAMTAYLLFKGSWLTPSSNARIARLTEADVYLGRLFYYTNNLPVLTQFDVDEYTMTANKLANPLTDNNLPMNLSIIQKYTNASFDAHIKLYDGANATFANAYQQYISTIYSTTYNFLLNKYRDKLLNLQYHTYNFFDTQD